MGITVKKPDRSDFVPAPAGLHRAVCVDVIDMGLIDTGKFGVQDVVRLVWQTEAMGADGKLKIKLPDDAAAYVAGELWAETLQHEQLLTSRLKVYQEIGGEAGIVERRGGGQSVQAIQVNINISDKATAGIEEEDQILDALWEEL